MSLMALVAATALAGPVLPAQHGQVIVSGLPGLDDAGQLEPSGAVVTLFDIRLPPEDPAAWPLAGTPWSAPADSNLDALDDAWTLENLGLVFGLACQRLDAQAPVLFVAASPWLYGDWSADPLSIGPGGPGGVYTIDLADGVITLLIDTGPDAMPNGGPGLGNICWDAEFEQLFAANLDDGRIYRISPDGTVLGSLDPFSPADDADGQFAALGDRPLAVARFEDRLYFSSWLRDSGRTDTPWPEDAGTEPPEANNAIWSVGVAQDGEITQDITLEFLLPRLDGLTYSNPVADIAFGQFGTMLLAERTFFADSGQIGSGHEARLLEYEWTVDAWVPTTRTWHIGTATMAGGLPANASGGAAWDCNGHAWATGDSLLEGSDPSGAVRLPVPGNDIASRLHTSLPIPIDLATASATGDVERIGSAPCQVKSGACCIEYAPDSHTCVQVTADECELVFAGQWTTLGAFCDEVSCGPQVLGACCLDHPDGAFCDGPMEMEYCEIFGGIWMGVNTTCEDMDCVTPFMGACCIWDTDLGEFHCELLLEDECASVGGRFNGTGVGCGSEGCCFQGGQCRVYLSTGVVNNTVQSPGMSDDQWGVIEVPEGETSPGAAIVALPVAGWSTNGDAAWINATLGPGPPGTTVYACEFEVDLSAGSPVLDLFVSADDAAVFTINDTIIADLGADVAGELHEILLPDVTFLNDGCNIITVEVENLDSHTGFYLSGLVALCRVGDLDGDGRVTVVDLLMLLEEWGPCPGCVADLDGDDEVGVDDLLMLIGGWDL